MINKEFLQYYEKFKDKIFNYFMYRVNFDREKAEDLTSEVFLKALENFDRYERDRPFQAWIYAIAHNHLVNHYRIAYREIGLSEESDQAIDMISDIDANLELERVKGVIEALPDSSRDILLMRFMDGLSNDEICQALGKEDGAVRTQMSRALKELRKHLE